VNAIHSTSILVFLGLGLTSPALADTGDVPDTRVVPQHSVICIGNTVDRAKLAIHLLARHPMSPELSSANFSTPSSPNYGPERWRQFITDPKFCKANPCQKSDESAINSIKTDFVAFVTQGARTGYYASRSVDVGPDEYFLAKGTSFAITCTAANPPPPTPPAASLPDNSPLRVRGTTDDLYLDRKSAGFATTSKATLNYSGDASKDPHTQTTKVQGAFGYAIDLGSTEHSFITAVPYIAANESLTLTQGKPATNAPYNFVASGVLLTDDIDGRHFISLRPQYQDNTTQKAQLASLRAIYAPWTRAEESPFLPFNTPVPLNRADQSASVITAQFLFDLRTDLGTYTQRGDAPYNLQNQDFARFGTKTGFAISATPANLPTFTLTVAETYLYGVTGSLRNLTLFETALTMSLDPHSYYGVTLGYTNGFNEDTAVRSQTWTFGFSAHL
jgi:hypothetical protein